MALSMNVWAVFRQRGFFQQCTDEAGVEALAPQGLTAYTGFDPTADSFHVGHLIPLMALMHLQRAGGRPIALLGGGTAMIGDPTGKNDMRKMLSEEELAHNTEALRQQVSRLLDFSQGAVLVNNADWLLNKGYIQFLREVGHHFSVNRMLTFETFRTRMETGLSFIEFNYPLLQSYDFLELHKRYGCTVQLGGDDQWANIISGVDLVRRMAKAQVYGWTFPLLTTASGAKMGKTEKGAVWLSADKTSPYDYYQYWVNIEDADVAKCLGYFTLLPMEEVRELARLQDANIRQAKQKLAYEATRLIHGDEAAAQAQAGARAVFGGGGTAEGATTGGDMDAVPTTPLAQSRLAQGWELAAAMEDAGLVKSRSEARRLIQQGGLTVNDIKVTDPHHVLQATDAQDGQFLIRMGKKRFHRLQVE